MNGRAAFTMTSDNGDPRPRNGPQMTDPTPQERSSARRAVRMSAVCRSSNGLRDEGWLEDISAAGCCFVTRGTCFKVGSHVILRPEGLEGISGIVRWVHANRSGIEFNSPLYGAVLEHLCNRFGHVSGAVAAPPAPDSSGSSLLRRLF
jgi:hypothetical protein